MHLFHGVVSHYESFLFDKHSFFILICMTEIYTSKCDLCLTIKPTSFLQHQNVRLPQIYMLLCFCQYSFFLFVLGVWMSDLG